MLLTPINGSNKPVSPVRRPPPAGVLSGFSHHICNFRLYLHEIRMDTDTY